MSIIHHFEASAEERSLYLKQSRLMRGDSEDIAWPDGEETEETSVSGSLSPDRYATMSATEQFILTVSENGFGKRTSSFEYRVSGRGGKGITAIATNARNGKVVASFPVEDNDQIMLVTNAGQLIRCPVHDIRIAGRATQGVRIFHTRDDEQVVSVEHIPEAENSEDDQGGPEIISDGEV
jgi:DNA gyrase subunit A